MYYFPYIIIGIVVSGMCIIYIYNYQKNVKDHIKQNDEMYEMIKKIYKRGEKEE